MIFKFYQWFNPREWTLKLLGYSKAEEFQSKPGLVMIQIDGFSKTRLEEALARHEMPFLKQLIEKSRYQIHPFYPGLPSTTPAVQGELFYGVKQAVPSFFFFDKKTQKIFKMFDGECVREVERRISSQGQGLLEGGSSYSNIYSGGAKEAHFCAGCLGWNHIWKDVNPLNFFLLVATHFLVFLRIIFLTIWETILAVFDFFRGVLKKEDLMIEFKFITLRVLICIVLRELITLAAIVDTTRGLPIIHLNLLGYDEQAHRRGPDSKVAHWALQGIDKAIKRIYNAAINSTRRHYDVWIYSDHGQEPTIPYVGYYGQSVAKSARQVYHELFSKDRKSEPPKVVAKRAREFRDHGVEWQRGRYLGKWTDKMMPEVVDDEIVDEFVAVAAMGPIGGITVFKPMSKEDKHLYARELVRLAKIPLVMLPEEDGGVRAWNEQGEFVLPQDAEHVIGADHPYLREATKDLMILCHHPNSGTFTISGRRKEGKSFSFPFENGAHAGFGKGETDAFALLPADGISLPFQRNFLKIHDLREGALRLLRDRRVSRKHFSHSRWMSEKKILSVRLMTYNVHSCLGIDGKCSPERIASVIGRYQPDIVCLQELDMGHKRSGDIDQPHMIAKKLEMLYHFHPSIQVEEQKYGNAILSRFPIELVQAARLPGQFNLEARGALWISLRIGELYLQIINTHLSLYAPERFLQAKALVSSEWITHERCAAPVILCGDFNCIPKTGAWKLLNRHLHDVQLVLEKHRPMATWFGRYPIGRIDHIFVSPQIKVTAIDVPRIPLAQVASDHLPLIVDLEIPLQGKEEKA